MAPFAAFMTLHPAVEYARSIIPRSVYAGRDCDCFCILESRPWYAEFNYWFWILVLFVPVAIMISTHLRRWWRKLGAFLITVLVGYGLINLSVHLMWKIRNAPFVVSSDPLVPDQATWNMDCANIGDGASLGFTLLFGWVPVLLYGLFCFVIIKFSTPLFQRAQQILSSNRQ